MNFKRSKKMNKSKLVFFLLMSWVICIISGCMGGSSDRVFSNTSDTNQDLTFSITPTLQLNFDAPASMTALLINNTNKKIDTISFQSDSSNLLVLDTKCESLEPGKSCKVDLQLTPAADNGGYLLRAFAKDDSGKEYTSKQLFSYSSLTQENILTSQLNSIKNKSISLYGETFALAIPFNKKVASEEVTTSLDGLDDIISQEIVCSKNDNTQCTFIAVAKSTDSGIISVRLATNNEVFYSTTISLLASSRGNLVSSSYNVIVSPANGESSTSFTLFNNGSESINSINIFATNHPAIESRISIAYNDCSGILVAGASCTISVKVNGSGFQNDKLSMTVSYKTTLQTDTTSQTITDKISLWLYYLNTDAIPAVSIADADFTNNLYESTGKNLIIKTFNVTNTGNVTLRNVKLTKLVYIDSNFSVDDKSSCNLLTSLDPSQTCQFKVTYSSGQVLNNYIKSQVSATYKDSNGLIRTIVSDVNSSYYNTNGNFAYFSRGNGAAVAGVDFCNLVNTNGSVSNCKIVETANSEFNKDDYPYVIRPMFSADGQNTFLYIFNSWGSGFFSQCTLNRMTGTISNCAIVQGYSDGGAKNVNGHNIYQQGVYDSTTNKLKYYIYIGSRELSGTDKFIGLTPITESGIITSTNAGASFTSIVSNPAALMFEESKIYMFGDKDAQFCTIDSSTGATVSNSCNAITGNLSDYLSSSWFNSVVTAVINNNGLKTRYVYLSDLGSSNGDTANVGRIIRCTLGKNSSTGNLDFTNCGVALTGLNKLYGLEVVSFESKSYLYYTDSSKNESGLFSYEILSNGDLGNLNTQSAVTFKSGGNTRMNVLTTPSAYFKYDKINYTVNKGESFTMKMNFVGSGTIGSSRLFFSTNTNLPSGITINGLRANRFFTDFAVEPGFDTKTITVNVAASILSNTYTLKGITSNGVRVPDITITVK